MVSVIIPIYNAEPYLCRCLDSVLNSTYRNFEVILVNDGSTDGSLGICQEYASKDSRIHLISQQNKGVSAARNRALEECHGEWAVFVDADDMIAPNFLGLIAREEYQNQDLLLFDFVDIGEESATAHPNPDSLFFSPETVPELLHHLFLRRQIIKGAHLNLLGLWGKAYRMDLITQHSIRFSPQLFYGEDTLFNVQYFCEIKNYIYTPEPAYLYRFHVDSSSHRFNPKLPYALAELLEKIRGVLDANHLFSTLEKDFYTYTLDNLSYTFAWSVFNSTSTNSYREKMQVCRNLRNNKLYCEAIKYNYAYGDIVRRTLIFLFQMRLYPAVGLLAALWSAYLTWKNRR